METFAHFENIPWEIGRHLGTASAEIVVAVAWFTDSELFDVLCRQAGRGVRVSVAVLDDGINIGAGKLNFARLSDIGGKVYRIPPGTSRRSIMRHKFCVIDRATVILGSYNWTKQAQSNDENITVVTGAPDFAAQYLDGFNALLGKHGLTTPAVDAEQVRRRLEVVRNLLLLGDQDMLSAQLEKVRPAAATMQLAPLFEALDADDSDAAVAWIDDYLKRAVALTVATDQEVAHLKLTLRGLEYQLSALSDEKVEIERQIHAFSVRSSHEIGELTTRYLRLRAEKLRRQAATEPEVEPEAEEAQADYEEYREASQKCHPDKVDDADRDQANDLFVQLQAAYRQNDLAGVRAIHAAVREGRLFVDRSAVLTEVESLGRAVLDLRQQVQALVTAIRQLYDSQTYRTLKDIEDWAAWFVEQRESLEQAIADLEAELAGGPVED
jgi:predicted thioesterase